MKMDKSLSIMLKMREKIRGEEPKCFRFGVCYISVPFASSVNASRYTSRIKIKRLIGLNKKYVKNEVIKKENGSEALRTETFHR